MLDDLGLQGAIEEFVERLRQPGRLEIGLQLVETQLALPAAVEVAAFRIVQEAVNNAVKHAQATLITVTLTVDEHAESPLVIGPQILAIGLSAWARRSFRPGQFTVTAHL